MVTTSPLPAPEQANVFSSASEPASTDRPPPEVGHQQNRPMAGGVDLGQVLNLE
jgi:hypothetical protein